MKPVHIRFGAVAAAFAGTTLLVASHGSAAEGSNLTHRAMIPQLASDSASGVLVIPTATATPTVTPTPQPTVMPPYAPPAAPPGRYGY